VIRSPLAELVVPSPNVGLRRGGQQPDILLLHYTGMRSAESARHWLCDPRSEVSCHYLVEEGGRIIQMVGEEMRAWHAGISYWAGETDINSRSIGIEIHNPGHEFGYRDFPAPQMRSVIALARDIVARHGIPGHRVLGHSDVAPSRKSDPGEKFDWAALAAAGVGFWVPPAPIEGDAGLAPGDQGQEVLALQRQLAAYGYGIAETGQYDDATVQVVRAFQRHFRPSRVDGVADRSTVQTLKKLLAALPP
jgi:N-acetylmuramoyl-L-alanine amidase